MSYQQPSSAGNQSPANKTNLPGIFLIIVGIVNLLGALFFSYRGIQAMGASGDVQMEIEKQRAQMSPEERKKLEDLEKQGFSIENILKTSGKTLLGVGIFGIVAAAVTIYGGLQMRNLTSYWLAVIGAFLAILPCISPTGCCGLGEGVGIWALIVLFSSDVKSAFR